MIKILSPLVLLLLLTACSSQENGEEKKFNTEKKVESKSEQKITTAKQLTQTPSEKEINKTKITQKTETYAKNIFELTTSNGEKLHVDEVQNGIVFQEHKNKVIFLLFFGHRCPPCIEEIPALKKLVEEKGDKLEVIAIEVQRLPEKELKNFKIAKKLNYTLLSGRHKSNSKFISYIGERAQWNGSIPFLVGIMPNGEVGTVHVGGMSLSEMKSTFNQLAKKLAN